MMSGKRYFHVLNGCALVQIRPRIVSAIFATLVAFIAAIWTPPAAANGAVTTTILNMNLYGNRTYAFAQLNAVLDAGCTAGLTNRISVNGATDENAVLNVLLAAFLSGRTIYVRNDGCDATGQPKIGNGTVGTVSIN